jgi:hypothetical protein
VASVWQGAEPENQSNLKKTLFENIDFFDQFSSARAFFFKLLDRFPASWLAFAACIARNLLPRVRPKVCGVQEARYDW